MCYRRMIEWLLGSAMLIGALLLTIFVALPKYAPIFTLQYVPFVRPLRDVFIVYPSRSKEWFSILSAHPQRSVDVLTLLVGGSDFGQRLMAIEWLGMMRSEPARRALIDYLRAADDLRGKRFAVIALGECGGESAVQYILETVDGVGRGERKDLDLKSILSTDYYSALISSLRLVDDARATQKLMQIAQDPSHPYRLAAIEELGMVRHPTVVCFLCGVLLRDREISIVREMVYRALRVQDDARVLPIIKYVDATSVNANLGERDLASRVIEFLSRPDSDR